MLPSPPGSEHWYQPTGREATSVVQQGHAFRKIRAIIDGSSPHAFTIPIDASPVAFIKCISALKLIRFQLFHGPLSEHASDMSGPFRRRARDPFEELSELGMCRLTDFPQELAEYMPSHDLLMGHAQYGRSGDLGDVTEFLSYLIIRPDTTVRLMTDERHASMSIEALEPGRPSSPAKTASSPISEEPSPTTMPGGPVKGTTTASSTDTSETRSPDDTCQSPSHQYEEHDGGADPEAALKKEKHGHHSHEHKRHHKAVTRLPFFRLPAKEKDGPWLREGHEGSIWFTLFYGMLRFPPITSSMLRRVMVRSGDGGGPVGL